MASSAGVTRDLGVNSFSGVGAGLKGEQEERNQTLDVSCSFKPVACFDILNKWFETLKLFVWKILKSGLENCFQVQLSSRSFRRLLVFGNKTEPILVTHQFHVCEFTYPLMLSWSSSDTRPVARKQLGIA